MVEFFDNSRTNPLDEAQEMVYQAWEAKTKKRRVALAKKALTISSKCADAYSILAEETAKSPEEALDLYRKGVEAGQRALGKKAFQEYEGSFWGFLETRPYMRARAGLAQCLWDIGKGEEAVEHYQDMLRLNPNDNQGIRYVLMTCLLELGRNQETEVLLKKYKNDAMAVWNYSRALLDFRKSGDCRKSRKSLETAIIDNQHVPAFLLGLKKIPRYLPPYYSWGGEDEAILYVYENLGVWQATPGALEWLDARWPRDGSGTTTLRGRRKP